MKMKMMDLPSEINYESLLSSAQRWTQRALVAYTTPGRNDSDDSMLLFCAISWEHLCKAYLYSLDHTSIFNVTRRLRSGQPPTITLREAQSKIWGLRGLTQGADRRRLERLNAVADIRNGVLHSATLKVDDQRGLFVEYLRSSEEIYRECSDDTGGLAARWGDFLPLVTALIDEPCNLLREQVETKKLIATWRRREIIDTGSPPRDGYDYDGVVNELIVGRLNEIYLRFSNQEGPVVHRYCPVCKEDDVGAYTGTIIDESGERPLIQVSEFICAVCELHLSTVEEMKMAGVSLTVDLYVDD